MEDCTPDNIVSEHLDFCVSEEVTPGINETEIYAAPYSDLETIAALPAIGDVTNYAEAGTIVDSHVFKEGKGFYKVQLQTETGEVTDEAVGAKGSKSTKNMLSGIMNSKSARNIGYFRVNQNRPMLFLVRESTGQLKQIGTSTRPAYWNETKGTSGKTGEDSNSISISVEAFSGSMAPVYAGTVTQIDTEVVPTDPIVSP